jgi:hypothetical protein
MKRPLYRPRTKFGTVDEKHAAFRFSICARLPPKIHQGASTLCGAKLAPAPIRTTSCMVSAKGHSSATVRWSEHFSPLSGSLN